MIHIAIVDDLAASVTKMNTLLDEYAGERHLSLAVDSFSSGEAFLQSFKAHAYHMIFLDIFMNGMKGTEVAARVRQSDQQALIVFLTTSTDFMYDAFDAHAFQYITKPFTKETIYKCLSDAERLLPAPRVFLTFLVSGIEKKILYSDILYLSAANHYTKVVDRTGKEYMPYIYYASLSKPLLDDRRFLQVSRGILCNMDYIVEFTKDSCILLGGHTVPITIRNAKKLQQTWHDYTFSKMHQFME